MGLLGLAAAACALIGLLVVQPGTGAVGFWVLLSLIFVGLSLALDGYIRDRVGRGRAP